jgi:hypothetical protein
VSKQTGLPERNTKEHQLIKQSTCAASGNCAHHRPCSRLQRSRQDPCLAWPAPPWPVRRATAAQRSAMTSMRLQRRKLFRWLKSSCSPAREHGPWPRLAVAEDTAPHTAAAPLRTGRDSNLRRQDSVAMAMTTIAPKHSDGNGKIRLCAPGLEGQALISAISCGGVRDKLERRKRNVAVAMGQWQTTLTLSNGQ